MRMKSYARVKKRRTSTRTGFSPSRAHAERRRDHVLLGDVATRRSARAASLKRSAKVEFLVSASSAHDVALEPSPVPRARCRTPRASRPPGRACTAAPAASARRVGARLPPGPLRTSTSMFAKRRVASSASAPRAPRPSSAACRASPPCPRRTTPLPLSVRATITVGRSRRRAALLEGGSIAATS